MHKTPQLSLSEAKTQGLIEHLEFSNPKEPLVDSQYGRVTHGDWVRYEAQRIAAGPGRKVAIVTHDGKVALFVDNIAGIKVVE